jgi:hypothetical protein
MRGCRKSGLQKQKKKVLVLIVQGLRGAKRVGLPDRPCASTEFKEGGLVLKLS